jgi:GNAT superfamily N-acetyltransferase
MVIEVRPESPAALEEYAAVPIAFRVESRLDVAESSGRFSIAERQIEEPFWKDYDAIAGDAPTAWTRRFRIEEWGLFSARLNGRWIGAAAVAADSALLARDLTDVAVIWDLRVSPDHRREGVGRRLWAAAEAWARERRCRALFVETQDINVAACRFYREQGCVLSSVDRDAYPASFNEVQLIWCKELD